MAIFRKPVCDCDVLPLEIAGRLPDLRQKGYHSADAAGDCCAAGFRCSLCRLEAQKRTLVILHSISSFNRPFVAANLRRLMSHMSRARDAVTECRRGGGSDV